MRFIFAITLCVGVSLLPILGCHQENQHQMIAEPDDASTPNPVDDADPVKIHFSGTVVIGEADDSFGNDEFALNSAMIVEDTLEISVSYSGGCETHKLTLIASEQFLESFPVQLHVSLAHNAMGDTCEAYLTEDYHFDLTPIKTMYQRAYGQDIGTVVLKLKDFPQELRYTF